MMAQIEGDEITVTTKEGEADVIEVPEGMLLEIDSLLNHERVLKIIRPKNDPISDAEVCLLGKWGYLVCYPNFSVMQFAAYAEVEVLLGDLLAGGWFE